MARKDISAIVSGAGLLTSVWTELMAQVQKRGGDEEDIHRLTRPEGAETIEKIAEIIVGNKSVFSRDMRKEGWTLIEDATEPSEISIAKLKIASFLKKGEDHISGEEMRSRSKERGKSFGQRHAEYLLEHRADIPEDWRNLYLVFPGTLWRNLDGDLYVRCMFWDGERWYLGFRWLECDWGSDGRLLCVCK